jgi:hypothetical protein
LARILESYGVASGDGEILAELDTDLVSGFRTE